jgi:hypothetical protein
MAFFTIAEREKILTVIDYLISKGVALSVDIQGSDEQFSTKVVRLKGGGKRSRLIIEKLYPESGNSLIQSSPDVVLSFEMGGSRCVFVTKYLGINTEYPEFGHIVGSPSVIQITERRTEERIEDGVSEFLSVELTVAGDIKVYRLKVINIGSSGIGLIVNKENSDLLEKVEAGDRIGDLRLFLPEAILTIDGTVRHKTEIPHGTLKGNFILGIDTGFIAELDELKERLKKKT